MTYIILIKLYPTLAKFSERAISSDIPFFFILSPSIVLIFQHYSNIFLTSNFSLINSAPLFSIVIQCILILSLDLYPIIFIHITFW